jgi:5-methylcytosine-specific restriction enzyme A
LPTIAANPAQSLPWRDWYSLQRWRKRARHQLRTEPLCAACLKQKRVTPATIADHDPPHKGDWNAFRLGPLQSLCADCHAGKWAEDKRGYRCDVGDDGLPIDPNHPFNRGRAPPQPLLGYADDSSKQPAHIRLTALLTNTMKG